MIGAHWLVESAEIHQSRPLKCQRLIARRWSSLRGNRRAHRGDPGETAGAEGIRPRPHLYLRGGRPGGGRHPGSGVKLKIPGVPSPTQLRRYTAGQPLVEGPVLVSPRGGKVHQAVCDVLERAGIPSPVAEKNSPPPQGEGRVGAIIFDATGISDVSGLAELHAFIAPAFRKLLPSGRLIVFGTPPEDTVGPAHAAAQRALDGFVRSAGKEARLGSTANLIYVAGGAENGLESTLRFFLSGRSAYISGQVIQLTPATPMPTADWDHPLGERAAGVTGAARGIGAAIAETLSRDGAQVIVLDVPAQGAALAEVANTVGGIAFQIDITAEDAPAR